MSTAGWLASTTVATAARRQKAQELVAAVSADHIEYATLVEVRHLGEDDIVILDLDISVPQRPVVDIRERERIGIVFASAKERPPDVRALRDDFPFVLHVNLLPEELPRSLCLYEEPFREIERGWTPSLFVDRIRWWLSESAHGRLHREDQLVEPLFIDTEIEIVLPSWARDLNDARWGKPLSFRELIGRRSVLVHDATGVGRLLMLRYVAPKRVHSISRIPNNLEELATMLDTSGEQGAIDMLEKQLDQWRMHAPDALSCQVALLAVIPICRTLGTRPERHQFVCAAMGLSGDELAQRLDLWDRSLGPRAEVLVRKPDPASVGLSFRNVCFGASPDMLAQVSGQDPSDATFFALGAGALGSTVLMNLARSGFGKWGIADLDWLAPHNLARHAAMGNSVGQGKAEVLANMANTLTDSEVRFHGHAVDARTIDFGGVEAVVDLSASGAVSRSLAHRDDVPRALSAFLSPSGKDLIVLAEGTKRSIRLDSLEQQYLRAVYREEALHGHFDTSDPSVRYGQSCRDITARIPQTYLSVHGGIAAHAIRAALESHDSAISIWRIQDDFSVRQIGVQVSPIASAQLASWRIVIDHITLAKIRAERTRELPNETGGVLLGSIDTLDRVIYVVDALPAPGDSVKHPTSFIRGRNGLASTVASIRSETMEQIEYVGEWHSHPTGASTLPSQDDRKLMTWIVDHRSRLGLPGLMLIVGDTEVRAIGQQFGDKHEDALVQEAIDDD